MSQSVVLKNDEEIFSRLSTFGVSQAELQDVALAVAAGRNEATPLDPKLSPGMYAFIHGVRALKTLFCTKDGWIAGWNAGVDFVANKDIGVTIIYSNVDYACRTQDPIAISDKGNVTASMVDNPSGHLFSDIEAGEKQAENSSVWVFCVSYDYTTEEVCAELSRPRAIEGRNFGTLAERIFIIKDSDWNIQRSDENDDKVDLDIDFEITPKS